MRVKEIDLAIVALIIGYVAFYTHPPPRHIQDFLSSPVGTVLALGGILLVTAYHSLLVGIFLAIAFISSVGRVTEYLDPKEQKPTKPAPQPKSKGVSPPEMSGVMKSLLGGKGPAFKGDSRLPQAAQKKGTSSEKPSTGAAKPKPSAAKTIETFASF
jgi:hypothetical protein